MTANIFPRPGRPLHVLKTAPLYFWQLVAGVKTAEIRRADRDFQPGDQLLLCELTEELGSFTGWALAAEVLGVLRSPEYLAPGFVMLSIKPGEHPYMLGREGAQEAHAQSSAAIAQRSGEAPDYPFPSKTCRNCALYPPERRAGTDFSRFCLKKGNPRWRSGEGTSECLDFVSREEPAP